MFDEKTRKGGVVMYQNSGQARRARAHSILTQEFRLFPHFTAWRDYPCPVVGSFLFAAFWMVFAGGIESPRTAADLAGTVIFAFTGGLRQFSSVQTGPSGDRCGGRDRGGLPHRGGRRHPADLPLGVGAVQLVLGR